MIKLDLIRFQSASSQWFAGFYAIYDTILPGTSLSSFLGHPMKMVSNFVIWDDKKGSVGWDEVGITQVVSQRLVLWVFCFGHMVLTSTVVAVPIRMPPIMFLSSRIQCLQRVSPFVLHTIRCTFCKINKEMSILRSIFDRIHGSYLMVQVGCQLAEVGCPTVWRAANI